MNSDPASLPSSPTEPEKVAPARKRRYVPSLMSWIVGTLVFLVFAGLTLPVFTTVSIKSPQTKSLAQAKQIGLALKLFAGDHDGVYPHQGVPVEMTTAPTTSNAAFACLFPTYVQSESIFANKQSAYQTRVPDNVIDNPYTGAPVNTLAPGENAYSYVMGLTDNDDPSAPLVADGTDGTGHYVTDPKKRGGVWKGARAVVVRLDNSAAMETPVGPPNARFVPRAPGDLTHNLLDVRASNEKLRLLDPAAATR